MLLETAPGWLVMTEGREAVAVARPNSFWRTRFRDTIEATSSSPRPEVSTMSDRPAGGPPTSTTLLRKYRDLRNRDEWRRSWINTPHS